MPNNDSPSNHPTSASNRGIGQRIEDTSSIVMRTASLTPEPRSAARPSSPLSSPSRTTVEYANESRIDSAAVGTVAESQRTPHTPRKRKLGRTSSSIYESPIRRPPPVPEPRTPITYKLDARKEVLTKEYSDKVYLAHASEASDHIVGPMPVAEFINAFLPVPVTTETMPRAEGAFNSVPKSVKNENELYDPMVKAIKRGRFCPSVSFLVTATCGEERGRGELKPDVCAHDKDDVPHMEQTNKSTGARRKTKAHGRKNARANKKYRANLGLAEMFWEFKVDLDCFDDTGEQFLAWKRLPKNSPEFRKVKVICGQIVAYAAECCSRQHRAFLFSVLIVGTKARLFRWDRAGIIVTESFDYHAQPDFLCEFLWRFHHANPVERGFDSSVTVASKDEEMLFQQLIAEEVAFQIGIDRNSKTLDVVLGRYYQKGKVTKVKVYDKEGKYDEVLVCVPRTFPKGTAGRATRGFWGVKLTGLKPSGEMTGVVVFLKDSWRVDVPRVEEEGVAYEDLNGNAVINVSTAHRFGNVLNETVITIDEDMSSAAGAANGHVRKIQDRWVDMNAVIATGDPQTTGSQDFVDAGWVHESLKWDTSKKIQNLHTRVYKHTHYRVILGDVGLPLSEFTGSLELFEILSCILEALISAYEKCRRLHRDVSVGNIIIVRLRDGRRIGVLIDWEFSCKADELGCARDYTRSGTCPFMSARALQNKKGFRHDRKDDFESLFYVAIWACVKWLPHDVLIGLNDFMTDFFSSTIDEKLADIKRAANTKLSYMMDPPLFPSEFTFEKEPINKFFADMYKHLHSNLFADMYKHLHSDLPVSLTMQMEWTAENLRQRFAEVCQGLSQLVKNGEEENDKCLHRMDDLPASNPPAPKATYTPGRMSGLFLSDYQNSKRSLRDAFGGNGEGSGKEKVNAEPDAKKRKFVDSDDQPEGAVEAAHSAMLVPPSTMATIESGISTCSMEVLKDGSSRSNKSRSRKVPRRSSRLSGKAKSDTSVKSKASSLSAKSKSSGISTKSSKSSLRHPRKARSDTSRRSH